MQNTREKASECYTEKKSETSRQRDRQTGRPKDTKTVSHEVVVWQREEHGQQRDNTRSNKNPEEDAVDSFRQEAPLLAIHL